MSKHKKRQGMRGGRSARLPGGWDMNRAAKFGLGALTTVLFGLTILYPFCLYTQNPVVAKWRTLYIETAMSTLSHQWLATTFIPQSIIDNVMKSRYESQDLQDGKQSQWDMTGETVQQRVDGYTNEQQRFFAQFDELDHDSFLAFVEEHPDVVGDGYDRIDIDYCDRKDDVTGIKTTQGDDVRAINAQAGILIVEVKDDDYNGRLAFVKDASRVSVGTTKSLFDHGQFVRNIAERYDALLAINASGFEDPGGNGNGGTPYGFVKSQGSKKRGAVGGDYKIIGFDEQNRLRIGRFSDTTRFRDAVEFTPALIIDGERLVKDSAGWGLQPRSAIGQKEDQTVMLLVVDGRQPGHSLGCTVNDCAGIFERYGAVQASNLDGGSSSVMYYNGREITRPTTASMNKEGRYLPDAFIVT